MGHIEIGCEGHKRELMRYLLIQTSLVRLEIKPGEVFFVQNCYRSTPKEPPNERNSATRQEILKKLGLPWQILKRTEERCLVLFYHPTFLHSVLSKPKNREYLASFGYAAEGNLQRDIDHLEKRFSLEKFPHEIGLFLGYPLKDVVGFMNPQASPTCRGNWIVYGDPRPSLAMMSLFRKGMRAAEQIVDQCRDWDSCIEKMKILHLNLKKEENACQA